MPVPFDCLPPSRLCCVLGFEENCKLFFSFAYKLLKGLVASFEGIQGWKNDHCRHMRGVS